MFNCIDATCFTNFCFKLLFSDVCRQTLLEGYLEPVSTTFVTCTILFAARHCRCKGIVGSVSIVFVSEMSVIVDGCEWMCYVICVMLFAARQRHSKHSVSTVLVSEMSVIVGGV